MNYGSYGQNGRASIAAKQTTLRINRQNDVYVRRTLHFTGYKYRRETRKKKRITSSFSVTCDREEYRRNLIFTCEEHSRLRRRRAWRMIVQRRRCNGCCQEIVITAGTADRDETVGSAGPRVRAPSRHDALARLRHHLIPKNALRRNQPFNKPCLVFLAPADKAGLLARSAVNIGEKDAVRCFTLESSNTAVRTCLSPLCAN